MAGVAAADGKLLWQQPFLKGSSYEVSPTPLLQGDLVYVTAEAAGCQLPKVTPEGDGKFAVKDSRFWVVRPRVGASGVSGLTTLLSGSYIGADAGRSSDSESNFVGLETPPPITGDQKGRQYTLHGDSLGSIDIGSPIFYRRVQVGQVVGVSLDKGGTGVTMQVFVSAPFDQYVGTNSRWWHASGVDLRLDSSGFTLNTQSLATVLLGGIAFQTPPNQQAGAQAMPGGRGEPVVAAAQDAP